MRNLEDINPEFARPNKMASFGALLPLIMCCGAIALADGAAPDLALMSNPLSVFFLLGAIVSLIMTIVPRLFKWDWDSRYFGFCLLYFGSAAVFGGVPWLCFLFFGAPSLSWRMLAFVLYFAGLCKWCYGFVVYYKRIYDDSKLRPLLYEVGEDSAFYLQRGDTALAQRLHFRQVPANLLFVLCVAGALILLPFMGMIKEILGLPSVHIFLGILSIPIDMLALGQVTRAVLIFYVYPSKIWRDTGNRVCVDMGTPVSIGKTIPRR